MFRLFYSFKTSVTKAKITHQFPVAACSFAVRALGSVLFCCEQVENVSPRPSLMALGCSPTASVCCVSTARLSQSHESPTGNTSAASRCHVGVLLF